MIDQSNEPHRQPTMEHARSTESSTENRQQEIFALLRELDLQPERLSRRLTRALEYLASHSDTLNDETRARTFATDIARYCEQERSPNALSKEQWHHVQVASTFTDIGKVGPAQESMTPKNEVVTRLYANRDPASPTMTLEAFIQRTFADAQSLLGVIPSVEGLSTDMPMRSFWNKHPQWTLDHLRDSGIDPDVALTAAAHHMLEDEGANPQFDGTPLIDKATGMLRGFGIERPIDHRDIWVVLLDKYEANITRANATHEAAIAWLNRFLTMNETLAQLPDLRERFLSCLRDMDAAFSQREQEIEQSSAASSAVSQSAA
jgi:hypothetical protein